MIIAFGHFVFAFVCVRCIIQLRIQFDRTLSTSDCTEQQWIGNSSRWFDCKMTKRSHLIGLCSWYTVWQNACCDWQRQWEMPKIENNRLKKATGEHSTTLNRWWTWLSVLRHICISLYTVEQQRKPLSEPQIPLFLIDFILTFCPIRWLSCSEWFSALAFAVTKLGLTTNWDSLGSHSQFTCTRWQLYNDIVCCTFYKGIPIDWDDGVSCMGVLRWR